MKLLPQLALLLIVLFSFSINFYNSTYYIPQETNLIDSVAIVKIAVVGDLMCHSTQYQYAKVDADSFNFIPVFRYVEKYFKDADFTFGNLETVLAGKERGYAGYPFFNTPDDYVKSLKEVGFDFLVTANNHSLDKGYEGLKRTIKILNETGIKYSGTFDSQKDRDSVRIFNINGITFTILAYSYGTNGMPIPKGKEYIINLIDEELIKNDIEAARKKGVEIVIVHFHFGEEYKREPNAYQQKFVNIAIKNGADIIVGDHPHVLQPAKYFKTENGKIDSGFIAYSLGNFFSNQQWRYSDVGAILNFEIEKHFKNDSLSLRSFSFVPTWVFRGVTENGKEYILLPPSDSTYSFLNKDEKRKMYEAFEDSRFILRKYESRVDVK